MDRADDGYDTQLGQIERSTAWVWALSAILMLGLAVTLLVLYWTGTRDLPVLRVFAPASQVPVGAGICGLTALFCLYSYLRQRDNQHLTRQLFEARMHEDALRSRIFELTSLFDMAGDAHLQEDLDPLLETVTRRLLSCLEADRTSILLLDPESQELRCRAASGSDSGIVRDCRITVGEGISGWVAQNNEPLILNDEDTLRRFATETRPGRDLRTAMSIPLSSRGHALGVLNVSRMGGDRPFTPADARLLTTFAEHIAAAIHRIDDLIVMERERRGIDRENRDALARSRAKEVFLEAANEDLRGPLTCILAYGEFLSREDCDLDNEKRTSFGRILNEQARRLADVVAQSAMLLRLDAKEATLDLAPASLNDVVSATINDTRPAAEAGGVSLVARIEPEMPPISLDSPRLRQGVKALLGKAIQLSESGSTLRVATERRDGHARVEIEGSRMNIAPQDLVRALELGDEGASIPNRSLLGLELGLHLLKRVVELHGGRVWTECTPSRQTIFAFEVPLSPQDVATATPLSPGTGEGARTAA